MDVQRLDAPRVNEAWRLDQLERDGMAWPPAPWETVPGYPQPQTGADVGVVTPLAPTLPPLADEAPHPNRWSQAGHIAREVAETLILTIAIFFLIRQFFQNFRIEGYSMEPTLHSGQFLIVNKALYKWLGDPERGDIVVLEPPRVPDRDYIKRIVGLPGETVEVRQGQVYVNGKPLDERYLQRRGSYTAAPITLAATEYYVLGDNRDNSNDSHNWGPLPRSNIVGKAWVIYWPIRDWGLAPNYSFASN